MTHTLPNDRELFDALTVALSSADLIGAVESQISRMTGHAAKLHASIPPSTAGGTPIRVRATDGTLVSVVWVESSALNGDVVALAERFVAPLSKSIAETLAGPALVEAEVVDRIAQALFDTDTDATLLAILEEAIALVHAERGSLFFVSDAGTELVARLFDCTSPHAKTMQSSSSTITNTAKESDWRQIRIPISQGIVGAAVATRETVVSNNAQDDTRFNATLDKQFNTHTRSLLAVPIVGDDSNRVVAVLELMNKCDKGGFSEQDVHSAARFAACVAATLRHAMTLDRLRRIEAQHHITMEMITEQWRIDETTLSALLARVQPDQCLPDRVRSFDYNPKSEPDTDTVVVHLVLMMRELGLLERLQVPLDTAVRFVHAARRAYRSVPYHNFFHAATVTHFAYALCTLTSLPATSGLTPLERDMLFISCLCHDLDHRGTNGNYLLISDSPLASLYASEGSLLERHHLAQATVLLSMEGCQLLSALSSDAEEHAHLLLKHIVLATDLGCHFRDFPSLQARLNNKDASSSFLPVRSSPDRLALLSLCMTACDLSAAAKSWDISFPLADLVYEEFFNQGDLERARGKEPLEMFDRSRANKNKLQVGFLRNVCLPVYSALASLFPVGAQGVLDVIQSNLSGWEKRMHNELAQ